MKDLKKRSEDIAPRQGEDADHNNENVPADSSRRSFLGTVGGATAALAVALPLEPLFEGKHGQAEASVVQYGSGSRTNASWQYRDSTADNNKINVGELPDNGDAERFTDFSGSWSKCLPHPYLGIVNRASWQSLVYALQTGRHQDFNNILVGNPGGPGFTGTLNGPEGALAFDLEGLDSHATDIPPAPSVASAQTAAEEVEHYWAALMRDVNFTDYATSSLAAQACADLNNLSYVRSHNSIFPYPVTPQNLFRGQIVPGDGSVQGPYVSQFLLQPTFLGAQPLSQMFQRLLSVSEGGADYRDQSHRVPECGERLPAVVQPASTIRYSATCAWVATWPLTPTWTRSIRRTLSPSSSLRVLAHRSTRVTPISARKPNTASAPLAASQAGPVDCVGTIPEMATRALKAAWFHKWVVNLRQRPEE